MAIVLSSGRAPRIAIVAAITTSAVLAVNTLTPVNAAAGNLAPTLPTGQVAGSTIIVEKRDSSTNTVTVTGSMYGSPAQTIVLRDQYDEITLIADGTGSWYPASDRRSNAALDARIGTSSSSTVVGNRQTGSTYTVLQTDAGKEIEMNNAAANVVTLPSGLTAGSSGSILQYGAGPTSIALGGGVTAVGAPALAIGIQGGVINWRYISTTQVSIGVAATTATPVYAATVTPNCDTTDVVRIGTLTGPLTLAAPTGSPVDGQKLQVWFKQDATGGRVVTYNAAYFYGTDVTAAMDPVTANTKWGRVFQWDSADAKWYATGIVRY